MSNESFCKLKVAVVEPIGGHGGNEFYDFGLCEAVALSHDVYFFTCDKTVLHEKIKVKTKVIKSYKNIYGKRSNFLNGLNYVKGTLSTLMFCLKHKINIVHFHIYRFSRLEKFNLNLFKLFGFKIVATIHDIEPFYKYGEELSINYNNFLNPVQTIIVHTDFSVNCLKNVLNKENFLKVKKVKSADLDFVYNVDIDSRDARKMLGLPSDKRIVLFFGQIKKVKGVDLLIQAFKIVAKEIEDAVLVIAGKPWKVDMDDYIRLIGDEIRERVYLRLEYIPNEDVPKYFKAADIVVLPYKKIYNSSVILRAFDYGSAVIASDLDTFKEFIGRNEKGVLFKSEDVDDLAEKMKNLILDSEKIEELKAKAKQYISYI